MGTKGMGFSLPSRDIICRLDGDRCWWSELDAFVAIGGCDKNMPGSSLL